MASEIRVNTFKNRSGLGTVSINDSGASFSGVVTATSFSGDLTGNATGLSGSPTLSIGAGSTSAPSLSPSGDSNTGIFFPSADTIAFAEGGVEALRIDSSGRVGLNTNIASGEFYNRFVINSPDNSCWMSLHSAQTGSVVNSDGIDIGLNGSNQGHFWLRENADLLIATNNSEKARVTSGGNVQIANGNLVFSTSGTGIDFSATSDATGMTSELLDDYEEGDWTPSLTNISNVTANEYCRYIKIGNSVTVYMNLLSSSNNMSVSSVATIAGLPFGTNGQQVTTMAIQYMNSSFNMNFVPAYLQPGSSPSVKITSGWSSGRHLCAVISYFTS